MKSITVKEIERLEALSEQATKFGPDDMWEYENGGGRCAVIKFQQRDLIADLYGEGPDRDYWYGVMVVAPELLALAKIGLLNLNTPSGEPETDG